MNNKEFHFCHLTSHIHAALFSSNLCISGFYNTHLAFDNHPKWSGEFQLLRAVTGKLKQFNVIYVCIAKPELSGCIIDRIREEIPKGDPNTVVVGAIDYAVEIWDQPFGIFELKHQLEQCDVITASEPALCSVLKALMGHRNIHLLPHPTNVEYLKRYRKPIDKRQKNIVGMIHRYDNNYKLTFLQLMDVVRRKRNNEIDYDIEAIVLSGDEAARIEMLPFFTKLSAGDEYEKQMDYLSRQFAIVDSYHRIHTYGRTVVDCAAVGVPLIGTSLQYLQNILFPDLCTKPYDIYEQQKILNRLIDEPAFFEHVVNYAYERVDEYGYEKSVDRFVKVILDEQDGKCDVGPDLHPTLGV